MSATPAAIQGVLFDLDGVLYVGSTPMVGAVATVQRIRAAGYRCCFVTNTSTLARASIAATLGRLGFSVEASEIITAPGAARAYLDRLGITRCALLLADDVRRDFVGITEVEIEAADWIVLGDIGPAWSYELLNRLFNRMLQGAQLIAVHRNRFWQTDTGLNMDIGGLVAALEYCTGHTAVVMGKPAPEFFQAALAAMNLSPEQAVMIGDDIDVDIGGGQKAGLRGLLVKTGKYREAYAAASAITPDAVLASVNDLPRWLGLSTEAV